MYTSKNNTKQTTRQSIQRERGKDEDAIKYATRITDAIAGLNSEELKKELSMAQNVPKESLLILNGL